MREHQNVGQVELTNASRSNEIGLARRSDKVDPDAAASALTMRS